MSISETQPKATVRRYPVRTRRPSDFYAKCGTHSWGGGTV